jgi:hypothetical protein
MSTFYLRFFCLYFLFVVQINAHAQQKKFTLLPSSSTGITFRNDITESPTMFY